MAKRIKTDAKIVLERAGYHTEYVYNNGRVMAMTVWKGAGIYVTQLPVNANCWIENSLIEELIKGAA